MAAEKLKRELGFRDVILFYIVSGLSLRWIATAAASGQSAIVVWLLAWCGFFCPWPAAFSSSLPAIPRKVVSTSGPARPTATLPLHGRVDLLDEQPALLRCRAVFRRQQSALRQPSR